MTQKVSTTILLLTLLGILQGVRSDEIFYVVKCDRSEEPSCSRGQPASAPDGDLEHTAGSLLQTQSAIPGEVEAPDEEVHGDPDEVAHGDPAGPSAGNAEAIVPTAGESSNMSVTTGLLQHGKRPDEQAELPLQTEPLNSTDVFGNSTGSSESYVGKQLFRQFPSLAQLSQRALVSRGKNAILASYARGELPYIIAALTVAVFVGVLCMTANARRGRGPEPPPLHQTDSVLRSRNYLPSPRPPRPGVGLGSALLQPGPVHGPKMHTGVPPSAASLPSIQVPSAAPASCSGLPPKKSIEPRNSFEQALNAATRQSLPSLKEMRPQLCVELVVPPGKECCLQLSAHPFGFLGDGGHIAVNDVQGRPVFDVGFVPLFGPARDRWGCFAREDQKDLDKRLVLRSAVDSYVFGSCKTSAGPKGGRVGLTLCDSSDDPFGVLQQDISGGFMLKAFDNWFVKIVYCGGQAMRFEDSDGWLLASIEGTDSTKIARIAPQVDAGLVVLVLLGMDLILQGCMGE